MKEMTVRPVSPAQPGTQGNNMRPQALSPTLAALLLDCKGAAEFAAKYPSSHREKAEDWVTVSDIPDRDIRDGKIIHALIAYELERLAGHNPEPLDMLHASSKAQKIIDACVGRVKSAYLAEQTCDTHPVLLPEHRVDCLAACGLPDTCTGYCDCATVTDKVLHVYEFKAGMGPIYYEQARDRCRLYGLGLISEHGPREKVVLGIIKPGISFGRRIGTTPDELLRWGKETMVALVRSVMQGERTYRPGPYCNVCPGRPLCRAWVTQLIASLDSRYESLAMVSPQQSPRLNEQEVAELLTMAKDIESCQRPLEEWAVGHIQRGGTIPGFRLGHNPDNLRFYDEAVVREILEAHGLLAQAQKLRTPFEMRRAIGNDAYEQLVAGYACRTPGKDVLRQDDTAVGGPAQ